MNRLGGTMVWRAAQLLLLTFSSPAAAGDLPWVEAEDWSAGPVEDLGGGLFRYQLPPGVGTEAEVWDDGKLWEYGGQEVFAGRERCADGREYFEWVEPADQSNDVPIWDRLIGTELVDRLGRVWILVDLDEELVSRRQEERWGSRSFHEDVNAGAGGHLERGIEYDLFDYTTDDCSEDGIPDLFLTGADSRVGVASPMNTYERKAVLVVFDPPGSNGTELCSGVMVDENSVLTAAHCVQDDNGVPVSALYLDVCTYGNVYTGAECWQVSVFVRPPNAGTGDIEYDYALVSIGNSQDAGVGWMAISTQTNSYIEARTGHNVGYPGYNGSCGSLTTTNVIDASVSWGNFARYQSISSVDLTANLIKTNADASGGQSGSPLYYFASGSSGAHYVSGVLSRWRDPAPPGGQDQWVGGPNNDQIYDWVDENK